MVKENPDSWYVRADQPIKPYQLLRPSTPEIVTAKKEHKQIQY